MRTLAITDTAGSMSSMLALVLFDSSVKAAVLLAIAFVSTWALRRASAAIRDRIWTLAFCGVMILPAISSIVPQWRIPAVGIGFPMFTASQVKTTNETATQANQLRVTQPNRHHVEINADLPDVSETPSVANSDVDASNVEGLRNSDQSDIAQTAHASSGLSKVIDYARTLLVLWLVGVVVLTVRFVMAVAVTGKLLSRGQQLTDPAATQLLNQTSIRLGLARRVKLVQSDIKTIPMTMGVFRPTVLIPANWRTWPVDRFRFVLLHELAHVKRLDVLFQSIARMACSLYWFNPLAWYALHKMRIDCELACDDQVIATGETASTYAGELIQIARIYRPARFISGIAMARSSKLDGRIVSLLDAKRPHGPVSRKASRSLLTLSAGLVFVLAAMSMQKAKAIAVEPAAEKTTATAAVERVKDKAEEAQGIPTIGFGTNPYEQVGMDYQNSRTGGICFVAASEAVQKELGLDDASAKKVRAITTNCRIEKSFLRQNLVNANRKLKERNDLTPDELKKKWKDVLETYEADLKKVYEKISKESVPEMKAVLTAVQLERLQQIAWQAYGSKDLLAEPELTKSLELTNDQIEKITAINEEYQRKGAEFVRAQTFADRHLELDRERDGKAVELLTTEQKERLTKLKGKPFNLELVTMRPAWQSTRPAFSGRPDLFDLGGIFRTTDYGGVFAVLDSLAVQKDLGLSDEILTKIQAVKQQFTTAWRDAGGFATPMGARRTGGASMSQQAVIPSSGVGVGGGPDQSDEERSQAIAKKMELWYETTAKFQPQLKEALTPEQYIRFQQINWQAMGTTAFLDAEVIHVLGLTKAQQDQIKTTLDEYRLKRQKLIPRPGFGLRGSGSMSSEKLNEMAKELDAQKKEQDTKIYGTLTKDQLDQFAAVRGKPFRFPLIAAQPAWYLFESGLRGGLFSIVGNEAVQQEIGLSRDDAANVVAIKNQFNAAWREAGGRFRMQNVTRRPGGGPIMFSEPAMPPWGITNPVHANAEQQQEIEKMTQLWNTTTGKYQQQLKEALTAGQFLRLQQIKWQAMGSAAFSDTDVIQSLAITKEQQDQIASVTKEFRNKREELVRQSYSEGGNDSREKIKQTTERLRASAVEQDAKTAEALTKDQLDQFAAMKGIEFDVDQLLEADQLRGPSR